MKNCNIIIGLIGCATEIFMRYMERWLIRWKGKG
jgi:ABC-type nitrate/sulfonate/bicarbonate transport system permease component